MLATYGIDTLDPATSLRRVRVLTERLPSGAWPDAEHPMNWSVEAYLLAQLIDEVAALHYTTVRAHGGRSPKPRPFRRPTPKRREPTPARSSWGQLADALLNAPPSSGVVVHRG